MKDKMHKLYQEQHAITEKLNEAAKQAFPIGSEHTCTNWRTPVQVTVEAVHSHDNIWVLSQTGRKYRTSAVCLGVEYC